jgi:hypothetical protein
MRSLAACMPSWPEASAPLHALHVRAIAPSVGRRDAALELYSVRGRPKVEREGTRRRGSPSVGRAAARSKRCCSGRPALDLLSPPSALAGQQSALPCSCWIMALGDKVRPYRVGGEEGC